LAQASFGATRADLTALTASTLPAWLNDQFAKPITSYKTLTDQLVNTNYDGSFSQGPRANVEIVWRQFAYGQDQLRKRMVWALSQIFVIGQSTTPTDSSIGPYFWDVLNRNAFGNYRELLEEVSTSSAMGLYLSHSGNEKEDAANGRLPDENYAREIMQLFTIGLWELNPDGTQKLNAQGKPIPTYGQEEIRGMAKVFTGWGFARCVNDPNLDVCFRLASKLGWNASTTLAPYEGYHSRSEKRIIGGKVLPANRTAHEDLKDALDTLFAHPNVGPFVSKQLIQRFVTSNPSPAYVARVAAKFNDNGAGVRGDMKAVLTAILTDADARDMSRVTNDPRFGKVREPVLRWVNFLRTFTRPNPQGRAYYDFNRMIPAFGQWPYQSPSIFNFYRPDYMPPGLLTGAKLSAPELQITHEFTIAESHNEFGRWTSWNVTGAGGEHVNDYDWLVQLAGNPAQLVDALDELLTYKALSAASRAAIIEAVTATGNNLERAKIAMRLFLVSPDYLVLK
jgi:uncharacterized protein (DUF1800 family)